MGETMCIHINKSRLRIRTVLLLVALVSTAATARQRACCSFGISYHGGSVMTDTVRIYYIWYGTWDGSGNNGSNPSSDNPFTRTLLKDLINGLNGSPYEQINTTYSISNGGQISGLVEMGGEVMAWYSHGANLL